jgi:hypothetical protein
MESLPQKKDIELMVWIDHKNLKPFGKRIGNFEKFEFI